MSEKILVRGVNWVGDAVMSMPALKALRRAYPDASLTLLVKPAVSPLFDSDRDIDEVLLYDERFRGLVGKIKLALLLRRKEFSKAILFQNAFDAAFITFLGGVPERIGYDRDGRGFLLTKPVPFNHEDRKGHHIDYYLNLLKVMGVRAERTEPWISLTLNERLSARERLSVLARPILGINPGASYGSAKRWFPERFAEVANWFIRDTGGSVVIFGGKKEIDIAEEIDKNIVDHKLFLAGRTTLRDLISLISECDVLVTNDSGPMHIAYGVGTPLVAIFGSTAPDLTGYADHRSAALKNDFHCSPCFERTCKTDDMKCMWSISSDDVYIETRRLLADKKAVFLDRDGTLCRDAGYLNSWDDFDVFSEIANLRRLKDKGFLLIGLSNQSGISRGSVERSFVEEVNRLFVDRYGFDDFFYCPHHPDEHCPCRKPEPGMLVAARARHKINLRESYVVGDKDADMLLAKAVGARGILVKTGQQDSSSYADSVAADLKEAVDLIVSDDGL